MNKTIKFIAILLLTPFLVKASIVITIISPQSTGLNSDNLSVNVQIVSTYSISALNASVSNRTISLSHSSNPNTYTGIISLTGLSQGPQQINIFVQDVLGNTQTATRVFTFDSPPVVTVSSPINYASFIQSKIHIKASVSDAGNTTCNGKVSYGSFSLNFVNNIDTIVDVLPNASSLSGNLTISAIDNSNQVTTATKFIYVDKSTFLTQYFTDTGRVIDFKDTRALVLDVDVNNLPVLKIVNTATRSSETINLGNNVNRGAFIFGILLDTGAGLLLNYNGDNFTDSVYIWKNGSLTNVSKPLNTYSDVSYGLIAQGNNMMWQGRTDALFLTNLTTLNTSSIAYPILNNGNDFNADGTIVYSKIYSTSNYVVEKYTVGSGATQVIGSTGFNIYPSVDKNNIVYTQTANSTNGPFYIHLYDGSADYNIGQVQANTKKYKLYNGYVAFSKIDLSNVEQVWTRSPGGVFKQQSFFSTNSATDALSNNGRVIFNNAGTRYYADSLTAFKAVQSTLGTTYVLNNNFYVAIGGSIYRYNIPSATLPATLTSFSPSSAATGSTVSFKGANFTNVTAVNFGGIAASSFTILSDTTMTAVVGAGATGAITIITSGGAATLAGFNFLQAPTIASFTPTSAATGAAVTITGTNFTSATAVSFGGTPASSYTINSATSITAVVGAGASGGISVTSPGGTGKIDAFTFLPPTITVTGTAAPLNTLYGLASVTTSVNVAGANLTAGVVATAPAGFEVSKDNITFSNTVTIGQAGTFTALPLYIRLSASTTVGSPSGYITLTTPNGNTPNVAASGNVNFALPATNFNLTNISATCKGTANGLIAITAQQNLSYMATVTNTAGGSPATYAFSTGTTINNLAAGSYSVCITVAGQSAYQQCFTSVITEPKDLSLYASVVPSTNKAVLSLDGGDVYHITLNGITTTTNAAQVTLTLKTGINQIAVSTDKDCQGTVTKTITIAEGVTLFPNPFTSIVSLNLGNETLPDATVRIYDSFGKMVYTRQYKNQSGIVNIDLSKVTPGLYTVQWTSGNTQTTHKIIKN